MIKPTLKHTRVQIEYSSSDGYNTKFAAKAGAGSKHRTTGDPIPPQHALIAGLGQLAQVAAMFGFEDEALGAVEQAIAGVKESRAQREAQLRQDQGGRG